MFMPPTSDNSGSSDQKTTLSMLPREFLLSFQFLPTQVYLHPETPLGYCPNCLYSSADCKRHESRNYMIC